MAPNVFFLTFGAYMTLCVSTYGGAENVLRHKMVASLIINRYSQSLQLFQVLECSSLNGSDFILH